jgi:transcriptional regulator with GAF, ATPase, and Fis domain
MFADISASLLRTPAVEHTLQEIVVRAAETVEGAVSACITRVHKDGTVDTPAYTDEFVIDIDRAQVELGEGPCLQASEEASVLRIDDMAGERRWPRFAERALSLGVGSMIACSLAVTNGERAALNLHAARRDAFDPAATDLAAIYAAHCSVALSQATLVDSLRVAMVSRQGIGEATGILMERHRVDSRQAFEMLVQASQRLNVKLRDLAEHVALTGQDPRQIQSADLPPKR